jgi:hypothetical protein
MLNLLLFPSVLLLVLAVNYVPASSARRTSDASFDPLAFDQQVATCPSINRTTNMTVELQLRTSPKLRSISLDSFRLDRLCRY